MSTKIIDDFTLTPALSLPVPLKLHCIQEIMHGKFMSAKMDTLAVEEPVAIVINRQPHAIMMITPLNFEDFAFGFAYTEGIISHKDDVYTVEVEAQPNGIRLSLKINSSCFTKWQEISKPRKIQGKTSCGLCGLESLEAFKNLPIFDESKADKKALRQLVTPELLAKILPNFDQLQPLRDQTGSMHAAAWVDWQGDILLVREDLGRHNALDKLIGALLQASIDPQAGFILLSSRASYEMVQKTLSFGVASLVSVSAATAKAVELAEKHHLQLIGFARPQRAVQYTQFQN